MPKTTLKIFKYLNRTTICKLITFILIIFQRIDESSCQYLLHLKISQIKLNTILDEPKKVNTFFFILYFLCVRVCAFARWEHFSFWNLTKYFLNKGNFSWNLHYFLFTYRSSTKKENDSKNASYGRSFFPLNAYFDIEWSRLSWKLAKWGYYFNTDSCYKKDICTCIKNNIFLLINEINILITVHSVLYRISLKDIFIKS